MKDEQGDGSKKGVIVKYIFGTVLGVFALFLAVCPILQIHIFTVGLKGKYVARIDCIEGYYVAVYENDVCHFLKDGEDCLAFGNVDTITDFDWKHEGLLGVAPYRRILCFSREVEAERYFLTDASGTVRYGMMYVLRTAGDTIHYYYRRDYTDSTLTVPSVLYQENITFSCDETTYALKNFSRFTTDIDFTAGEHLLRICDEPCYFRALDL